MIIVGLSGGLGNQMFQYAFGRSLEVFTKHTVNYSLYSFNSDLQRSYELDKFIMNVPTITNQKYLTLLKESHSYKERIKSYYLPYYRRFFITEREYCFDKKLFEVPDNCVVEGYFQSEKYFAGIRSLLLRDFVFKEPLVDGNLQLIRQIGSCESVSIHIRRGDYLKTSLHPVYTEKYYLQAIEVLTQQVANPHFFIFSDDLGWAKKYLKISFPITFVENNNQGNSYKDMQLMSACKHNIIANSSFSWWGAWLNQNPGKVVVAPYPWVNKKDNAYYKKTISYRNPGLKYIFDGFI
jgi:hypothetical protein